MHRINAPMCISREMFSGNMGRPIYTAHTDQVIYDRNRVERNSTVCTQITFCRVLIYCESPDWSPIPTDLKRPKGVVCVETGLSYTRLHGGHSAWPFSLTDDTPTATAYDNIKLEKTRSSNINNLDVRACRINPNDSIINRWTNSGARAHHLVNSPAVRCSPTLIGQFNSSKYILSLLRLLYVSIHIVSPVWMHTLQYIVSTYST